MSYTHDFDVLVLGAGASGLFCAMQCAQKGLRVCCLDHAEKPAAKVRAAGGGRCNATNMNAAAAMYVSANPHFVRSALARFTPWDAMGILYELGLSPVEEDAGKVFCSEKKGGGKALAEALLTAATQAGARIVTGAPIQSASKEGDGFVVEADWERFDAPRLVLALGGRSWPQLGASAQGYELAKGFGLKLRPQRPALTSLTAAQELQKFCATLAGVSLPGSITLEGAPQIVDDLLITHRGISGPAVLDASLWWEKGHTLRLDFLPGTDVQSQLEENPRMQLENALARLLPTRLAKELCQKAGLAGQVATLSKKNWSALESLIHDFAFTPASRAGYDKAEVTLGGVDTAQMSSKTMEAQSVPGLYIIGELLDVTGRLGGFNLHWAWASASAAAQSIVPRP